MINRVILLGRVTRDPKITRTADAVIANLTIATNRKGRDDQQESTFTDVDVFDTQAILIADHVRKGDLIGIEGRLKLDVWEDKITHERKSKMKTIAEHVHIIPATLQKSQP